MVTGLGDYFTNVEALKMVTSKCQPVSALR